MVSIREALAARVAKFLSTDDAPSGVPVVGQVISPSLLSFTGYDTLDASPNDTILQTVGGGDYRLYDQVLDDPQVYSTFQQRRLAVVSRPWEVDAGAEDSASEEAADFVREVIAELDFDRACDKMLYGLWYGYAVGELQWGQREGRWVIDRIVVPDRLRFGFNQVGELLEKSVASRRNLTQQFPMNFWTFRAGATHDHAFYGLGLAHWCYWPAWFAKQGMKFWAKHLEKYAMPTAIGKLPAGTSPDDPAFVKNRDLLKSALAGVHNSSGIVVPGTFEIELLQAVSGGKDSYGAFIDKCQADITKIILSQTMTTENGSSRSQSETHMDVRQEIAKADADLLCASFNQSAALWLTALNFPTAKPPRVWRKMEEEDDLDTIADRLVKLKSLGWRLREEAFKETFGDGFEYQDPQPLQLGGSAPGEGDTQQPPQFAAEDGDIVDRVLLELMSPVATRFDALLGPVRETLKNAKTIDEARIALLDALERMDADPLGDLMAKAGVTLRAIAEARPAASEQKVL